MENPVTQGQLPQFGEPARNLCMSRGIQCKKTESCLIFPSYRLQRRVFSI